jgi:hypothetical protein
MIKILVLDIETAPSLAYVWRYFQENISPKQVKAHSRIMSFAAKWLGEAGYIFRSNEGDNDREIIEELISLLSEADIVIAHNGQKFDIPAIRARALVHGLNPPSPVKIIDTYLVAKKEFKFPSNSLEYLADVMGCSYKKETHKNFPGFVLWSECLKGNPAAWEEMKMYNIQDIFVLEELYLRMRPWITNHPNVSVEREEVREDVPRCPKCNSPSLQKRGFTFTKIGKYPRFQCTDCGGWGRGRYTLEKKNENIITNEV